MTGGPRRTSGPAGDEIQRDPASGPSAVDRRGFLQATAGALVASGLTACASLQTTSVESRGGVVRLRIADHPLLQGPAGTLRIQPAELNHHLLVLAQPDGGYAVLSPICTHQGCTVETAGDRIACPCHGSEYERSGEVIRGPAERALTRYAAEVREGELVIQLGTA